MRFGAGLRRYDFATLIAKVVNTRECLGLCRDKRFSSRLSINFIEDFLLKIAYCDRA